MAPPIGTRDHEAPTRQARPRPGGYQIEESLLRMYTRHEYDAKIAVHGALLCAKRREVDAVGNHRNRLPQAQRANRLGLELRSRAEHACSLQVTLLVRLPREPLLPTAILHRPR